MFGNIFDYVNGLGFGETHQTLVLSKIFQIQIIKNINLGNSFIDIIKKISFEQFLILLSEINGTIIVGELHKSVIKKSNFIGNFFGITYKPPYEKELYLNQLFEYCKKVNSKEKLGKLLYYGIQFIHPFIDGNGRTGRILYFISLNGEDLGNIERYSIYLLNDGKIGRTEFKKILESPELIFKRLKRIFNDVDNIVETILKEIFLNDDDFLKV